MDTQKDIQKDTNISSSTYVSKKTEKIVSAAYLITNLFKDDEPLKFAIRDCAIQLLNSLWIRAEGSPQSELFTNYEKLATLLSVAKITGFVSEMNYSILDREIRDIIGFLNTRGERNLTDMNLFSGDYFNVSIPLPALYEAPREQATLVSRTQKDIRDMSYKRQENVLNKKEDKTNRRQLILNLLKVSSNLSIGEFSLKIADCSEKTIQRELMALITEGLVIRKGERRWSTYSLK